MERIDVKRKIDISKEFKISRMKEKIKPTKPHKHDEYHEFIFLHAGAGIHTIDETDHEVNPPTLFYLKPGQVHCWDFTKIPKGFVLIFKDSFVDEFSNVKRHLNQMTSALSIAEDSRFLNLDFEQILVEYKSTQPDMDVLKYYLNVVILKISHLLQAEAVVPKNNPLIDRFRSLVDKHYLTHRDLGFYADQLNVTTRQMSRLSSKDIGRTASSIITERIVMESKRLLRHTTTSISEVAYHLNFNDPSYFVKFFKSHTNLTPKEFREQF